MSWLVWLSWLLSHAPKGHTGSIPVRAHAWAASLIPSRGHAAGSQAMFLSLSLPLSVKSIKTVKTKQQILHIADATIIVYLYKEALTPYTNQK